MPYTHQLGFLLNPLGPSWKEGRFFLSWWSCKEKLLMKDWWMVWLCCCLYSFTFICISTRHRSQGSFFTFQCSSSLAPACTRTNQTSTFIFASWNTENISLRSSQGPTRGGMGPPPSTSGFCCRLIWKSDTSWSDRKCTGSDHYFPSGTLNASSLSVSPFPAPRNGSPI